MSTDAPTTDAPDEPEVAVDERREAIVARLRESLGDAVVEHHIRPGDDVWVRVARSAWQECGRVARDRLGCRYFTFLSAIDWLPSPYGRYLDAEVDTILAAAADPETAPAVAPVIEQGYAGGDTRFQVFARVANIKDHWGITFKVDVPDDDLRVDTWVPNYHAANWHERECHEMFGIAFEGHPFLEKLYLPGAFEGYPLRKDFPLLSRIVKPWPGIVDVEPMPGGDDEEGEGDGGDAG